MTGNPKFIDLFAGIGGFRLGFEKAGYECVFSSEIDKNCQTVYESNFGEKPFGDVTQINTDELPNFDVLVAGFPCQPFSISGRKQGFEDTRGTLFFDICRIIDAKNPKVVVLENVKHLIHHDNGNTFKTIIQTLEDMEYSVSYELLNSKDFGMPQNRERIIIIGVKGQTVFDFDKLPKFKEVKLKDFLDKSGDFEYLDPSEYTILENYTTQKTGLIFIGYRNKNIWKTGIRPNTEHLSRVHRQPNRIYSVEGTHPTIPSQETTGRFFIYLPDEDKVRKLTLNECYRIMGFPDDFKRSDKLAHQYRQVGNSVCVPMVEQIALTIKNQGILEMTNFKQEFRNFCSEVNSKEEISSIEKVLAETISNSQTLKEYSDVIIDKIYNQKGIFTVLVTLLFYKIYHPSQDIRRHTVKLSEGENTGFSGRSFDTANITPVLKELGLPSMAESGWLTRTLEQKAIYDLNYPGEIKDKDVKTAFLNILNTVQCEGFPAKTILTYLIKESFKKSKENEIEIVALENPDSLTISQVIGVLEDQFSHNYGEAGGAKLPMLAFHAVYSLLVKEMKKYEGCELKPMGSYTASDRTSNTAGDIEVFDNNSNLLEAVEIKLGIPVDKNMVLRAKGKILRFRPKQYYILSTLGIIPEDKSDIEQVVSEIRETHGCQLIINGLLPTLKYYLRLVSNISEFISNYSNLIEIDNELKSTHKVYWNEKLEELNSR